VHPRGELSRKLEELVEAFNAHDLDSIMTLVAPDCVQEMPRGPDPWGTRFDGKAAVREGLRGRLAGRA
jgi:ketosteroid isomerase-like protein